MTTRFQNVKKLARLFAMATLVTAVGLGLGAGTADAKKGSPGGPKPPCCSFTSGVDSFVDSFYGKHPEKSPLDGITDLFTPGAK